MGSRGGICLDSALIGSHVPRPQRKVISFSVSDETRQQPVAIRVTRPFATPDEFLDHEIETLTRTSITLLGAQPRPKGVILRFEVALANGQANLGANGSTLARTYARRR